ncbi:MAG: hypothetical protein AAGA28_14700 [Pseudomonadota bacterium]
MSTAQAQQRVLARVQASPGRRVIGVGAVGSLGVLMLFVALTRPPADVAWQVFLLVAGAGSLWMADTMRRATALSIDLTQEGLRCSDGEVIAPLDQIEKVDRGMFTFKPSNGFLLKLNVAGTARWRPGLWWRLGSRVGVGGVTPASQSKAMSEMIMVLKADQDGSVG